MTMTTPNTNTTPNDTERTTPNERDRRPALPRAPSRVSLSLSLSRAALFPIRPCVSRTTTDWSSRLSSRHRARTTSIVSIESTRQRARARSRRRLARLHASIASETPSVWWSMVVYTHPYTHGRFCVHTTYRVSVSTRRSIASPRDRPRADVEAGTNA